MVRKAKKIKATKAKTKASIFVVVHRLLALYKAAKIESVLDKRAMDGNGSSYSKWIKARKDLDKAIQQADMVI